MLVSDRPPPTAARLWLASVVLVVLLLATAVWWWHARQATEASYREQVQRKATAFTSRLQERMRANEDILWGAAGLFDAAGAVSRRQWQDYASRLDLRNRHPDILALGYAPLLAAEALIAHERRVRSEGFDEYRVWPRGERREYSAIVYIAPLADSNQGVLGYDMLSEPVRREAMHRARDTGQAALSGPVRLLQNAGTSAVPGLLLYVPVYQRGWPSVTIEQRRRALKGYLYLAYYADGLLSEILDPDTAGIGLRVDDGEDPTEGQLFANQAGQKHAAQQARFSAPMKQMIAIAGRTWSLEFLPAPELLSFAERSRPLLIAALGTCLSLLFSGLLAALAITRARARALAARMTDELHSRQADFQAIADNSPVGIYRASISGEMEYVNFRCELIRGAELGEGTGSDWRAALHPEDRSEFERKWTAAVQEGMSFSSVHRYVHSDGSAVWVSEKVSPLVDDRGIVGVVGSVEDITERRQMERKLEDSREFLHQIIELVPIPVFVKDSQLRFVLVNHATLALHGGIGADVFLGKTGDEALLPQEMIRHRAQDLAALASTEPVRSEERLITVPGEARWVIKTKTRIALRDGSTYLAGVIVDLTERRQAEEELARAQRLLQGIVQSIPFPLTVKDAQSRTIMVNPASAVFLGRSADALIGRSDHEVFPREQADQLRCEDEEALNSMQPLFLEQSFITPDGNSRWVLKQKTAVAMPDGRMLLVVTMFDITERKLAEALAEANRELLDAVIAAVPAPLWVKDEAGRWLITNEMGGQFLAVDRLKLVGKTAADLYSVAAAQRAMAQDARTWLLGQTRHEGEIEAINGEKRWGIKYKRALSLRDGRRLLITVVADLTDQRRAQEALRMSEARNAAVIATALDCIIVIDHENRMIEFNPMAEQVFGYRREEVLGQDLGEKIIPAQHREAHRRGLRHYLATGEGPVLGRRIEITAMHASGKEFPVELAITASKAGEVTVFTAYLRDISERKRAEEELRVYREHLEELVAARTQDMEQARNAAEAASLAKSLFLANMSHELRTPMHAILSFARMGVERVMAGNPQLDKLQQYFDRIDQSGERLLKLLNDLLDLSKLEAGGMTYDFAQQDLRALVRAAMNEFAPLANDKGVQLRLAGGAQSESAWCDAARIGQVIRNLLSNAIKFTPANGEVVVSMEPGLTGDGAALVQLRVQDSGVGIPEGELGAIFDKFVQSSKTRSGAGGTGLGLSISREIVLAHGGTVVAANRSEGGAQFTVTLLREAPLQAQAA